MKQLFFVLSFVFFVTIAADAQMNVGSSSAPDNSAMLQISGNTKGFLPPRLTQSEMNAIANAAKGLIVFNTTDSLLYMRRDTGWVSFSAGDQQWLRLKSSDNIYNANGGNVGIGTSAPSTTLHVVGVNPLTLDGVQNGTNTSSDSLLTITNGLVRKLPVATFGSGSVKSVSVASANGFAATVANATTTPAITMKTTVTGMVKGNGTALSAAASGTDYSPGTSGNTTGIVKSTNGTGALTTAAPADFPILNQNTTGTASNITGVLNATSLPALTGDVTSTAGSAATTISNGVVTNAKLATMAANTFKANNTGAAAAPADITATQATALLNVFGTAKGLVPGTTSNTTSFLRADGTFAVPPGTNTNPGTVTSVSVTSANGVSGTVANASSTPAISLTLGAITPTSVAATGTVTGANLSGTNTGDETTATIKTKLGTASSTTDGYLSQTDWNTFNNKANTANAWSTTGNAGTSATTNFIGTTDAQDLVLKANGTERMRIVNGTSPETGTAGDIKIGDATSGTVRTTKELAMRQDGDTYGPTTLRLRNRNGENGAIFETIGASSGAYLVDFIFRTGASVASQITSNIRFETRAGGSSIKLAGNNTEWQFGQPDDVAGGPTLVIGAFGTGSNSSFRIGNVSIGSFVPTAALHLKAGTTTATTAPLKFTAGINMSTPEAGAVEFDGTNYFATSGTVRYTVAKTLTATATLNFPSVAANSAATLTISVSNAAAGDVVSVGIPTAFNNVTGVFNAYVSAAGVVTVKLYNYSATATTATSGVFRVSIIKY